jgi:hypothetical protein
VSIVKTLIKLNSTVKFNNKRKIKIIERTLITVFSGQFKEGSEKSLPLIVPLKINFFFINICRVYYTYKQVNLLICQEYFTYCIKSIEYLRLYKKNNKIRKI